MLRVLINMDKDYILVKNGTPFDIRAQGNRLEQVGTVSYRDSLITKDTECRTDVRSRIQKWQCIGATLKKAMEKSQRLVCYPRGLLCGQ